ncbi:MAG: hypothetical protein HOK61_02040 [Alphaproteobacteria bacterium]|jgi:hypothetical protein|nr:hypothetical protein [Alphaproteobacteria bacterium]
MKWKPTFKSAVAAAFVFALAIVGSQPALANWRADLTLQMLKEEHCVVAFYSDVLEREVDGREMLFVHVVCEDNRAFDARRFKGIQKPFSIRPCNVDVC